MPTTPAIQKDKNPVASALFGVAVLQGFVGLLGWFTFSPQFNWFDWLLTFSFAYYLLLGILARWARLPAALLGAIPYAALLALQATQSLDFLLTGLLFKIPVIILLAVATIFALKPVPKSQPQV